MLFALSSPSSPFGSPFPLSPYLPSPFLLILTNTKTPPSSPHVPCIQVADQSVTGSCSMCERERQVDIPPRVETYARKVFEDEMIGPGMSTASGGDGGGDGYCFA